jgi:WD40 repeat protein
VVAIGKYVVTMDLGKIQTNAPAEGFSVNQPLICDLERPMDGISVLGSHEEDVSDVAVSHGSSPWIASCSLDGTVFALYPVSFNLLLLSIYLFLFVVYLSPFVVFLLLTNPPDRECLACCTWTNCAALTLTMIMYILLEWEIGEGVGREKTKYHI